MTASPHRVDVPAALEGQVRDAPNFSRLTIDQCSVQVRAAIMSLSVAKEWADAADSSHADQAARYIEDALRLLEGAPPREPHPVESVCIQCGQQDEEGLHHDELCRRAASDSSSMTAPYKNDPADGAGR